MKSTKMDNLAWRIRPYIPFTSLYTIKKNLDKKALTILDVGCGNGRPMKTLNRRHNFRVTGVDIFPPCIEECRETNLYSALLCADVANLPCKDKSFDVVIAMEILEHLDKETGLKFLDDIEKIARRQVIISTPVGAPVTGKWYHEMKNPHQEHKAFWYPDELKKRGYKVRGHGMRIIFGGEGLTELLPWLLRPIANILWVCVGPLVYYLPGISGDMVAVKTTG